MTCFTPLLAYRNPLKLNYRPGKGQPTVVSRTRPGAFSPQSHPHLEWCELPCKQCSGCRRRKSAEWATRCMHEASLHKNNCFITLTYSDLHMPFDGSISKRPCQLFLKKLRKKYGSNIRTYYCGEYGDKFGRPHYHFILFNHDFSDKKFWKKSKSGIPCFRSASLEELWPFGNSEIGTVTFESCAYVARYVMKKINGKNADHHYQRVDPDGRTYKILPEFCQMSLKPGIAKNWFTKFYKDVYPHDYVVLSGGRKMQPPSYYDGLYELTHDDNGVLYNWPRMEKIKEARKNAALFHIDNNTPERLNVRREIAERQLSKFSRNL